MGIVSERLSAFAEKMDQDLLDDSEKQKWEGNDVWWYLGKLVKNVRYLDEALTKNNEVNVDKISVTIANYSFIIAELQGAKKTKKKKKKKKKINK